MEQIKATRHNILAAISEHVNMAEVFTAAGIDPTEGAETFNKMVASTASKPRKHEDSITFRTNLSLFEKAVRPWLADKGMATARQIAENVDGRRQDYYSEGSRHSARRAQRSEGRSGRGRCGQGV